VMFVLIVDADPGFGFLMAEATIEAGVLALPVRDVATAGALVKERRVCVNVLVLNPFLPGASAFVAELRRSQGTLTVIGLVDAQEQTSVFVSDSSEQVADVDFWLAKVREPSTLSRLEWLPASHTCQRGAGAKEYSESVFAGVASAKPH